MCSCDWGSLQSEIWTEAHNWRHGSWNTPQVYISTCDHIGEGASGYLGTVVAWVVCPPNGLPELL